jgi:hypothetical protein
MDLALYVRVLWRYRLIVVAGTLLAIALMVFSMFKVSFADGMPTLTYREAETWRSDATLFVTQEGFPWGRIQVGEAAVSLDRNGEPTAPRFGDPERFADLAIVYSELAQSDAVRDLMLEDGPIRGEIMAEPMTSDDGDGLPLLGVTALADSADAAVELNRRQIAAFRDFIASEQASSDIPRDERVEVRALAQPVNAVLEVPRKKTRPLAIFMAVMILTIGLAFVLENLRQRVWVLPGQAVQEAPPPPPAVAQRRSA